MQDGTDVNVRKNMHGANTGTLVSIEPTVHGDAAYGKRILYGRHTNREGYEKRVVGAFGTRSGCVFET